MIKRTYYCDRCDAEVSVERPTLRVNQFGTYLKDSSGYDLCQECLTRFNNFMKEIKK